MEKIRNAPARYTLHPCERKSQINQAQSRANSAAPGVIGDEETREENSRVGAPGSAQANVAGATREIWFCNEETGAADTGDDSGEERLVAQQLFFLPQWQEDAALPTLASGACARTRFVHASIRLQTKASAVFMS